MWSRVGGGGGVQIQRSLHSGVKCLNKERQSEMTNSKKTGKCHQLIKIYILKYIYIYILVEIHRLFMEETWSIFLHNNVKTVKQELRCKKHISMNRLSHI